MGGFGVRLPKLRLIILHLLKEIILFSRMYLTQFEIL
jgi:hypothetical protein